MEARSEVGELQVDWRENRKKSLSILGQKHFYFFSEIRVTVKIVCVFSLQTTLIGVNPAETGCQELDLIVAE